jgi:hypothetical protein
MSLHPETFNYIQPTKTQMIDMVSAREAARDYAGTIHIVVPDGPDKTFILRRLREVAMWVNVAITRNADGSPRRGTSQDMREYPADHPVEGDLGSAIGVGLFAVMWRGWTGRWPWVRE